MHGVRIRLPDYVARRPAVHSLAKTRCERILDPLSQHWEAHVNKALSANDSVQTSRGAGEEFHIVLEERRFKNS